MKENLITSDTNNDENTRENILFKEVKKMRCIKYLNLFFSIFRTVLELYLFTYFTIFPYSINGSFFLIILLIYSSLFLPIFTLINLKDVVSGIFTGNFHNSINVENIFDCIGYNCCGNCCTNNVTSSTYSNLIYSLLTFIWSFYLIYFFLKDYNLYLQYSQKKVFLNNYLKKVLIKIILYFIDSFSLLLQSYFFYYHDYFLRKGQIYLEFYKRLIIKNREEDAELVRKQLPNNIKDFAIHSGQEMQNIAV